MVEIDDCWIPVGLPDGRIVDLKDIKSIKKFFINSLTKKIGELMDECRKEEKEAINSNPNASPSESLTISALYGGRFDAYNNVVSILETVFYSAVDGRDDNA